MNGCLWIWDFQAKQNTSSPYSWHLPKANLSLVPLSRIWRLSCEEMQSGRCEREVCVLKWQLGLTWKEHNRLPDCLPYLCSLCLTRTDICVTWNVYRWLAFIPCHLLWLPSPSCCVTVHQIWSPLTSRGGVRWSLVGMEVPCDWLERVWCDECC